MVKNGENIQLIDVDGPVRADYYPYNKMVEGDYGDDGYGSILITEKRVKGMLNEPRQPFCHCYVLACCLLGHEEWLE